MSPSFNSGHASPQANIGILHACTIEAEVSPAIAAVMGIIVEKAGVTRGVVARVVMECSG